MSVDVKLAILGAFHEGVPLGLREDEHWAVRVGTVAKTDEIVHKRDLNSAAEVVAGRGPPHGARTVEVAFGVGHRHARNRTPRVTAARALAYE